MATQAEICNMALGHIGISERIESISDDVPEADSCNLHYTTVLDKALAAFDWQFARRLVTLTEDADDPPDPWSYQYVYPADVVRPLRIDDLRTSRQSRSRIRFSSYTKSTGARVLVCDVAPADAKLWYTHRETNLAIYPEWFVDFLSWLLAAHIVGELVSDSRIMAETEQMAIRKFSNAAARDAETEQEDPEVEASWVAFRDGDLPSNKGIDAADYLP